MNLYVCSTPYHILVSLTHMFLTKEKCFFYLTTHDKKSEVIFKGVENKLNQLDLIEQTLIRKRGKVKERLRIEELKDYFEYTKVKESLENGTLYLFPWNPYSLYSISNFLYRKSKRAVFVEDGSNLYAYPHPGEFQLKIKKHLYNISVDFYKDEKLKNILVQYPEKYPEFLRSKLDGFSLECFFDKLADEDKWSIVKVFLSEGEARNLANIKSEQSIIILTQPLSEDGFISEQEKKKLYKDILEEYSEYETVILKKHPRERTEYEYENVVELDGFFPSEVFAMIGISFGKAIGVCTSAVNFIDAKEKINTDEDFLKRRKRS